MADAPTDAEIVLAALDSGEWSLSRHLPQSWLTDEGNRKSAWSVQRNAAPYCTDHGPRVWTGETALAALQKSANELGIKLPEPTPSPPVAAVPATPVLWVSPKQLAALTDPDEAPHGRYLPVRKTRAGMFTEPLYAQPQPQPAQPLTGARPERCPSCRNGDLYSCTCPFPTSRNSGPPHPDTAQPLTADQRQDLLAAAFYIACRNETGATLKDVDAERIAELLTELSGFDLARITAPSTPTPPEVAP